MGPKPQTPAEAERWAVGDACAHHADHYEDLSSVRGPGWFEAECDCGWRTSGLENVAFDALYDHMRAEHEDWWRAFLVEPVSP